MACTEIAYSLWIDAAHMEIPQVSKHKQFPVLVHQKWNPSFRSQTSTHMHNSQFHK